MIPNSKKNKNIKKHKSNYICYDKIKTIPKQNYIQRRNSNKNLDLVNYNNSLEIGKDLFQKVKKINKNPLKKKPVLSERIKMHSLSKKKNQKSMGSMSVEKNGIFKINNTDNNINNSTNHIKMLELNNEFFDSNYYDKNLLINNNIYDKKIIYYGENDKCNNTDEKININDMYSYNMHKIKNSYDALNYNDIYQKNNNNLNLKLSELSYNNYNFQNEKNLKQMKNSSIIKENLNLKSELDKFLKENYELKIKMNSLQHNLEKNEIIQNNNKGKSNINDMKRKYLSYKKSWEKPNIINDEDEINLVNYNAQNTDRKIDINYDNEKRKAKNHQINTIYDSMQFKLKKRKLSYNFNNVNKIINFNNSININNGNINKKKISLMNNSYNLYKENNIDKEKYFEEFKAQGYNEEEEENKIKENSIKINQLENNNIINKSNI